MQNNSSVKLSEESKDFLKNLGINRFKVGADKEYKIRSYENLLGLLVAFFKSDKESYLKLANMEDLKND